MLTMPWYSWIVIAVTAVVCFLLGILYRKKIAEREIQSAEEEAKRIINESIKTAESKKREALVEAKGPPGRAAEAGTPPAAKGREP